MRKFFVAAFAFVGLALTPAIASARPPAYAPAARHVVDTDFDRSRLVKERVEYALTNASAALNRADRRGLVSRREVRNLRQEIRHIRKELRQSLRFDGRIQRREEARLNQRLADLDNRIAFATQPRRGQLAWR